jgi:hypothetical protein
MRRGSLGDKRQLEAVDNPVDDSIVGLGLSPCLGPDPVVDIEPRVPPGEKPVRPFGAEKLLADKRGQNLPAEKLRQPRVVDPRVLWKTPASSTPPSVTRKWRCG